MAEARPDFALCHPANPILRRRAILVVSPARAYRGRPLWLRRCLARAVQIGDDAFLPPPTRRICSNSQGAQSARALVSDKPDRRLKLRRWEATTRRGPSNVSPAAAKVLFQALRRWLDAKNLCQMLPHLLPVEIIGAPEEIRTPDPRCLSSGKMDSLLLVPDTRI